MRPHGSASPSAPRGSRRVSSPAGPTCARGARPALRRPGPADPARTARRRGRLRGRPADGGRLARAPPARGRMRGLPVAARTGAARYEAEGWMHCGARATSARSRATSAARGPGPPRAGATSGAEAAPQSRATLHRAMAFGEGPSPRATVARRRDRCRSGSIPSRGATPGADPTRRHGRPEEPGGRGRRERPVVTSDAHRTPRGAPPTARRRHAPRPSAPMPGAAGRAPAGRIRRRAPLGAALLVHLEREELGVEAAAGGRDRS